MTSRFAQAIRNHLHVLIIVPLVVIVTTWPTFPRIFDPDEFWLHASHNDTWFRIWDSWHIERVLAGQADLYFTDLLYHPSGLSMAVKAFAFPHALLMVALGKIIPVDDAYNLLFLLILCFNAFCGYALIRHLMKDKWIGLYGAVVIGMATPFPGGQTVPDLIMIGTLPLTIYFISRSITERSWLFAGLAGLCAGVTPFIGVYVFAVLLLTIGIFVPASTPIALEAEVFLARCAHILHRMRISKLLAFLSDGGKSGAPDPGGGGVSWQDGKQRCA